MTAPIRFVPITANKVEDGPVAPLVAAFSRTDGFTPEAQLAAARHDTVMIRSLLAEYLMLTPEAAAVLAGDGSDEVRLALVENPVVPDEVLVVLVDDTDPKVAKAARARLKK